MSSLQQTNHSTLPLTFRPWVRASSDAEIPGAAKESTEKGMSAMCAAASETGAIMANPAQAAMRTKRAPRRKWHMRKDLQATHAQPNDTALDRGKTELFCRPHVAT
jgi:hypothetical protein